MKLRSSNNTTLSQAMSDINEELAPGNALAPIASVEPVNVVAVDSAPALVEPVQGGGAEG